MVLANREKNETAISRDENDRQGLHEEKEDHATIKKKGKEEKEEEEEKEAEEGEGEEWVRAPKEKRRGGRHWPNPRDAL